ncbi:MFS transporter [Kribbella sp. NPDC004536]|uniref:MFS transporter n=1 Tax=Kribbella sp. NPDC004536 TaxID=3364106 RepID=UPI0036B5F5C4
MLARTWPLGAGSFVAGTSAYVVAGLLPDISDGAHLSVSAAGQLATAFCLAYAIGAPVLATLTGRWERRTVLVSALALAGAGNLLTAIASNYPLLVAGRIVTALGAALYMPAAILVASGLLGRQRHARAAAVVYSGLTLCLMLGVPAASVLGPVLSFRGVFAGIAVLAGLVAVAARALLPRVAPPPVVGLRQRFASLSERPVRLLLVITMLHLVASIGVYTYIVPVVEQTGRLTRQSVSLLLCIYGIGAVAGNMLAGQAADRFGSFPTLYVIAVALTTLLATLNAAVQSGAGAAIVLFAWGLFTWAFNPPVQRLLLRLGGGMLIAVQASVIYLGSGLSAVLGGLVIQDLGIGYLPPLAAALDLAMLVMVLVLRWKAGPGLSNRQLVGHERMFGGSEV